MRVCLFAVMPLVPFCLAAQRPAAAQSLLEKLEKRLGQVIAPDEPAPDPTAAPADAAPPAETPPAADQPAQPGYLGLVGDQAAGGAGVEVLSLRGGGPAEAGGIRPGDVILSIGGVAVSSLDDMAALLENAQAGDTLPFEVLRNGRRHQVMVTLGAHPAAAADQDPLTESLPPPPAAVDASRPSLGVIVTAATEQTRQRYGLTVRRGAVISEITPGGVADRFGLPLGAAIVAFDGVRVDSPGDLVALVRGAQLGQQVELTYYQADQLQRKTVRLAPAAAPPHLQTPPPADPPLQLGRPGPQRGPLLDRLEGVLDGIVRPQIGGPPRDAGEAAALRQRVAELEQQLADLQQRLAELESRLPPPADPQPQE